LVKNSVSVQKATGEICHFSGLSVRDLNALTSRNKNKTKTHLKRSNDEQPDMCLTTTHRELMAL